MLGVYFLALCFYVASLLSVLERSKFSSASSTIPITENEFAFSPSSFNSLEDI